MQERTKLKITFLLTSISHVRFQKRINALVRHGVFPEILAFERDYYRGKPWDFPYESLGYLHHENYKNRLKTFFYAIAIIREKIGNTSIVYTTSLDILFISWLVRSCIGSRSAIVYEVGDIRDILTRKCMTSRLLRRLEKFLLERTDLLVVTSEAFIKGYFYGVLRAHPIKYQVIENKLDPVSVPPLMKSTYSLKNKNGDLKIGYFGLIRCRRSLDMLKKLVYEAKGRIKVDIRGIFFTEYDESEIKGNEFIDYKGPYVAPDDLPEMYGSVDLVWACYPYQGNNKGNWMWARTNRFYESCFYKKPMITQKGNEDGRVVETLDLGLNIDMSNIDCAVDTLLKINQKDLERWTKHLNQLPKNIFVYTDEHQKLIKNLKIFSFKQFDPISGGTIPMQESL